MKNISINELSKYKNNNSLLIDVRLPSSYIKDHIDGSINMPINNILTMLRDYPKDTPLILYCDRGNLSNRAGRLLKTIGYTNIYILLK